MCYIINNDMHVLSKTQVETYERVYNYSEIKYDLANVTE